MSTEKTKVLILCNDFPPVNSIGADRPYSWYNYFHEFNIYPVIITKNWISDGNTRFNKIGSKKNIKYTDLGCIIKTSKVITPSLWFQEKFGLRFSIFRKALSFIEKLLSFYILRLDQHKGLYREAFEYLEKNKDVKTIITTGEPFVLFRHGYRLKQKFELNWIADYRDGWHLNHISVLQKGMIIKFMRKWEYLVEKRICKKADMIVSVDPQMAGRLGDFLDKEIVIIYNGFWDYYSPLPKQQEEKNNKTIINHTGTLTIGQELELFMDALLDMYKKQYIRESNFEFNLIGLEYFPDQMARLLPYKEIVNKIVFTTPRLPKEEAVKMNMKADYLLNFTDPNLSAIYAKTYDYIACRKPILVVPGDKSLLENLILDNKLGYVLNNKREIEDLLVHNKIQDLPNKNNLDFFKRKYQTELFAKQIHLLNNDKPNK